MALNEDVVYDMFDFRERFYPGAEFMDAYWLARDGVKSAIDGDKVDALDKLEKVYAKLRFILENFNKYLFASRYIDKGSVVMDAPCGDGYGSALLAAKSKIVYAIDIDEATIRSASDKYGYENIVFITGDMMEISMPVVDAIVCLEGLEHMTPGKKLIERFANALSPEGILVVSVPINEHLARPDEDNPYHMEDYDEEKLLTLLNKYFSNVMLFGVDMLGSISDVRNALTSIVAVCEV